MPRTFRPMQVVVAPVLNYLQHFVTLGELELSPSEVEVYR
jgi:hypothetical protein